MVKSRISVFLHLILIAGLAMTLLPVSAATAAGTVLRVKPDGLSSGICGATWADSCDLQYATSLAQAGDQIWVAQGTYKPTSGTDRTISFKMKSGVAIYGGFAGTETDLSGRDPAAHLSVLSGDIGVSGVNTDNSYHVVYILKVDDTGILDGFTIEYGFANGADPLSNGAGLYSYLSNATVANLIIANNTAQGKGGGIYSYESNGNYTNITFNDNVSISAGGGMFNSKSNSTLTDVTFNRNSTGLHGGGMYIIASTPVITNAAFNDNTAVEHGGAILHTDAANSTITHATFSNNTAGRFGGTIANFSSNPILNDARIEGSQGSSGGAVYNQLSTPVYTSVAFVNNTALKEGGGMYNEDSDISFSDSVFSGNHAENGGGLYSYLGSAQLSNVNFIDNESIFKAGGLYSYQCDLTIDDVTFTSNTAGTTGGGMALFYGISTLSGMLFEKNSSPDYGGGFYITNANPVIDQLTMTGNTSNRGGGMYIYHSSPDISNAYFHDNTSKEHGGGFYTYSSSPSVTRATFANNSAGAYGGGMYNVLGTPVLTNVTFTGNSAVYGGGMFKSGGGFSLNNATFTNNSATNLGGGLAIGDSDATVKNTIFWGNTTGAEGPQIISFNDGVPVIDTTVIQGGCPKRAVCNNLIIANPLLGTLGDNGGFALTIPLLAGSSAIDAGDDAACALFDQRGVARPQGSHCDIGSYEYEFSALFSISGHVLDLAGTPLQGVSISDGAGHSTITNTEGFYSLADLHNGSYTITPSRTDYTFDPLTLDVSIDGQNVSGIDFTGTPSVVGSIIPAEGETLTTSKVTFDWQDYYGAVSYKIKLSEYADFHSLVFKAGTPLSTYAFDLFLKPSTKYYWRVCPIYADTKGSCSEVHSFYSMDPLASPALISPAFKEYLPAPVTLTWDSVVNAVTYKVIIAKDPLFLKKVDKRKTSDLSVDFALPEGKYYWRVKAFDASGGKGHWSVVSKFFITTTP
jgi:hypothetical protein